MLFSSIYIKDFLSIAEANISFRGAGLVLIDGYNHDDDSANGAGKTTIVSAIAYCLYGKLPRKITASEIARNGTSTPKVKIVTSCGATIARNKPTKLTVIKDGNELSNPQDFIEKLVGMTYEQFCLVACNPQNSIRFLEMNDLQKKDFFIELLALSDMDTYKDKIEASLKKSLDKEAQINREIGEIKARIESYQSMLQVVPLYEDTTSLLEEINSLVLTPPDLSKYDALEVSIQESIANTKQMMLYQKELSSIEESLNVLRHSIERKQYGNHTIECPSCQHTFIHGSIEADDQIEKLETHFVKLTNRRDQLRDTLGSHEMEDLNELANILIKCANKKKSLSKDFMEAQAKHSVLFKQLSKLEAINQNIASIEERNNKAQANIDKFTLKQNEIASKLVSVTHEIDLLKQTKAIFGPSGLPAYILDAAVNMFNERVAFYLSKIWVNADFFLNTYKETKGGDIKAKMSESFYNLGQTRSISSLSGGEYRLLCIAVDMAIIDMFSSMTGTEVQFVAWDEPFNGLDASNRARIWPILTQFAESREVWLIDHSTEFKSMFSNVIEIHKKDGISSVV